VLTEGECTGLTTTTEHTGTDRYVAPEFIIESEGTMPTTASDVYALGCLGLKVRLLPAINYRMILKSQIQYIYLKDPYAHRPNNLYGRIFNDIRNGIPPATRPDGLDMASGMLWYLLESCWNPTPEGRTTIQQLNKKLYELLWKDHSSAETPTLHITAKYDVSDYLATHLEREAADMLAVPSINSPQNRSITGTLFVPDDSYLFGEERGRYAFLESDLDRFSLSSDYQATMSNIFPSHPNFQFQYPSFTSPQDKGPVSSITEAPFPALNRQLHISPLTDRPGPFTDNVALDKFSADWGLDSLKDAEHIALIRREFGCNQLFAATVIFRYMKLYPHKAIPATLITSEMAEVQGMWGWCLIGDCGKERAKQKSNLIHGPIIQGDPLCRRVIDLYDHIREMHFNNRPFQCTLWCVY
jgi:serine/threonine protein kinase